MNQVTAKGAFFGQQFASWSGHDGTYAQFDSDVARALQLELGSAVDHPAVFGWNFETWMNGSPSSRQAFTERILATDAAGGINTMHWPMGNPFIECPTGRCGDNDNEPGIDPIALVAQNALVKVPYTAADYRPAGELFDEKVDELAAFLKALNNSQGEPIPIILRPFHEMNHPNPGPSAHWWTGREPGQFRIVFRRFVDRLRDTHRLNQLLIAFAPMGKSLFSPGNTPLDLYARYWPEEDPKDAHSRYVDVAAFDEYLLDTESTSSFFEAVRTTYDFAHAPGRVVPRACAVAECGRKDGTGSPGDGGPVDYQDGPFWTERILPGFDANNGELWTKTAYLMTWTNGTFSTFPGAPRSQALDFVHFFQAPGTLFLREVPPF